MIPRFKAWDKHLKKFVNFELIHHPVFTDSSYEFLLGMGRVDKDGQEIFEGDIVNVYRPGNNFIIRYGCVQRQVISHTGGNVFPVEFNGFYFEAIDNGLPYFSITENDLGEHDLLGTRIIGNIYENPEFLK